MLLVFDLWQYWEIIFLIFVVPLKQIIGEREELFYFSKTKQTIKPIIEIWHTFLVFLPISTFVIFPNAGFTVYISKTKIQNIVFIFT